MEQHAPTPVRIRQLLVVVLAAAALIWLMTGLFAPLTLGDTHRRAAVSGSGIALPPHRLLPEGCCSGVVFLFYLLLGL